jgi:poly(3-hydroxyoctanoate) depolymerase
LPPIAPPPLRVASRPAAWPPPADERHVAFGGLRLFVREHGEGRPLLLINGLGGNVQMWSVTQDRLSRMARTIAFDAPGTGRSRLAPAPLPLPVLAHVIGRLLDELGYERVDVVGYSLGGVIAQQLARTAPRRVRRMALVGTACGWGMAPPEPEPLALISSPLRYFSKRVYKATNHIIDGSDRFRDGALKEAQAQARKSAPPNPIGYAQQFLQGATWSSLHWGATVRVPTLVISGARDRLVPPANGLLLAHTLPVSRLHTLADEGHLMLFDPDSAALPLLEDFFSADSVQDADAWTTGRVVDDGDEVQAALRAARGAQPLKVLSALYRGVAQSALT